MWSTLNDIVKLSHLSPEIFCYVVAVLDFWVATQIQVAGFAWLDNTMNYIYT